jgi:hypothetical protein
MNNLTKKNFTADILKNLNEERYKQSWQDPWKQILSRPKSALVPSVRVYVCQPWTIIATMNRTSGSNAATARGMAIRRAMQYFFYFAQKYKNR